MAPAPPPPRCAPPAPTPSRTCPLASPSPHLAPSHSRSRSPRPISSPAAPRAPPASRSCGTAPAGACSTTAPAASRSTSRSRVCPLQTRSTRASGCKARSRSSPAAPPPGSGAVATPSPSCRPRSSPRPTPPSRTPPVPAPSSCPRIPSPTSSSREPPAIPNASHVPLTDKPTSAMCKYALADSAQRARVEAALRALPGHAERPEQSCAYRLDFASGGERVAVKQYTSGTLFLQGAGPPGPLFERLTGAVEQAGVRSVTLGKPPGPSRAPKGGSVGVDVERPFDPPWIGSDESGKGDYFGPLVACAVWVDERTLGLLDALGVRDSKALSDAQNRRLAQDVRLICENRAAEVIVPPERY